MKHIAYMPGLMVQKLARHLQVASPRPTAIFAVSDYLTLSALYASKVAKSIVSFDDSDFARYLEIPLTTVAQNMTVLGKRAAKLLIERMDGCQNVARWENIPVELRVCKSTAVLSSYT